MQAELRNRREPPHLTVHRTQPALRRGVGPNLDGLEALEALERTAFRLGQNPRESS